jgi:hypothetical protein
MLPKELGFEGKPQETFGKESFEPATRNFIKPFGSHGQDEVMHQIKIVRAIEHHHFSSAQTPEQMAIALEAYLGKRTGCDGISVEKRPGKGNFAIIHPDVAVSISEAPARERK